MSAKSLRSRLLQYGLDFQVDLNHVAGEEAARLQYGVPVQAEVLPVDLRAALEPDARAAPRVLPFTEILGVDLDLLRHAADGQVPDQGEPVAGDAPHAGALEGHHRILFHQEEIPGAQV